VIFLADRGLERYVFSILFLLEFSMAKKSKQEGEVNKSQAIRDLLKENPKIKANDAVTMLGEKGVKVTGGLFYMVKGKALGRKKRRKKREATAVNVVETASAASPTSHKDAVATIVKVKAFAAELGGLAALREIIEALAN
jgi:hypothetical protein